MWLHGRPKKCIWNAKINCFEIVEIFDMKRHFSDSMQTAKVEFTCTFSNILRTLGIFSLLHTCKNICFQNTRKNMSCTCFCFYLKYLKYLFCSNKYLISRKWNKRISMSLVHFFHFRLNLMLAFQYCLSFCWFFILYRTSRINSIKIAVH